MSATSLFDYSSVCQLVSQCIQYTLTRLQRQWLSFILFCPDSISRISDVTDVGLLCSYNTWQRHHR